MSAELVDILLQYLKAFIVGGGICLIAQIIINCNRHLSTSCGVCGRGRNRSHFGFRLSACAGRNKRCGKRLFFGDNRQSCCGKCRSDGSCCICFYNVDSL